MRLYLASLAAELGHRDVIAAAGGRLQRASEWDGSVVAFFYVVDQLLPGVRARAAAIDARVPPLTSVRVAAPADSGLLQIKEVLPIPYTVYISRSENLVWTATPLNTIRNAAHTHTFTTQAINRRATMWEHDTLKSLRLNCGI